MKRITRIRIEWGTVVTYLEHASHLPRVDWSGSFRVSGGRTVGREYCRIERTTFTAYQEVRSAMKGNSWRSGGVGEPIEGLILDIEGSGRTRIRADFTWGHVSFSLSELRKAKFLEWPVGPKYRCLNVRARLDESDPLDDGFGNDPLPEAIPPEPLVRVEPKAFRDARCFTLYYQREPAWIAQFQRTTAEFMLERTEDLYLVAYLMLGPPYATPRPGQDKTKRNMRFEIFVNGRSLGKRERCFSFFRSAQKVEEITLKVRQGILREGLNTLTIQNHDHCLHLLVIKAELRRAPFDERFLDRQAVRSALPEGYFLGFDTNVVAAENADEFKAIHRLIRDSGIGNFVHFRFEGTLFHAEDMNEWIRLLKEKNITFSYCFDETPYTAEMQRRAGRHFLGQHFHEISHLSHHYSGQFVRKYRKPTMRTAYGEYLKYVGRLVDMVKKASPTTNMIATGNVQRSALAYLGGADIFLAQTNVGHNNLLLAEARGSAHTFGKKHWGVHVAGGCFKYPLYLEAERMYELSFHISYLHGARQFEEEESALAVIHYKPYSRHSRNCRGRRALLARFKGFLAEHGDPGEPDVGLALMNGRYEDPFPALGKVWERFGGETGAWNPADPEMGWTLLDVLLPGVWSWRPGLPQNWKQIRFWYSGTPFGQFDVISAMTPLAKWRKYRAIFLPGWNSMNKGLYRKLVSYVRGGGHLFMALPQLGMRDDRGFLKRMNALDLINGGDLSDLFGVRIGRRKAPDVRRVVLDGVSHRLGVPMRNADVKVVSASVSASDQGGRPVLVENRVGKGMARLLTLREYPGKKELRRLMRSVLKKTAREARGDVWVEDRSGEVAWFRFKNDGKQSLWLLNTDWITAGNRKSVCVHTPQGIIPVEVEQGRPVKVEI